ncbi:MAG: PHP domain-containing protein [Candidatus Heimdallarchaeota archaeon]|nr:PHP domain-containing protein [Candidatus Heimdallarchaeota archaeon]MCK4290155.1 PHP domain-containing protein [Candidatus Heimdallarchaeota archaeon]
MLKNKSDSSNEKLSFIDLHLHTTASDGTFSPTQVVKVALELKLKAIAITDHDTVGGIPEALDAAENEPIEVIPGIEFSTELNSVSIHVVGLYVDFQNKELLELTHEIQNARENRAKKIIEKVNALKAGPEITFHEVLELSDGLIGRPHIGEVMIRNGYAKTMNEVFEKFLKRGGPCYVQRFKLSPKEAFEFLKRIGAIPILAHPGYISREIDLDLFIAEQKQYGLMGLEVYYPSHSEEQIKLYKELAKKYDLLESGGTDCHGKLNEGPFIGRLNIPYSLLIKIKERLNKE